MRLITQNSDSLHIMDFPYETNYIAIRPRFKDTDQNHDTNQTQEPIHYEIQIGPPTDFSKIWILAIYSTLPIATYAFELMLQAVYDKEEMFFQFPTEEVVVELMKQEQEQNQEQDQNQE